jgi:hypothetical protein
MTGVDIIGAEELLSVANDLPLAIRHPAPSIPFSMDEMAGYVLILGASKMSDGRPASLRTLRDIYGIDPDVSEPCFYNQDWYMKEEFMHLTLEDRWYLLRRDVVESSRAVQPSELARQFAFPSAILCAYTFFAYYHVRKEILWAHDFVWCSDSDHNGDRIYVGKYHDIDGVNKNGFSIHRHLALRQCYGAIEAR